MAVSGPLVNLLSKKFLSPNRSRLCDRKRRMWCLPRRRQRTGTAPPANRKQSRRFQNIPTANGSSSATGPWQITTGTCNSTVARYGLGYSASDINDPAAQATVASYIIRDTA